jgi:fructose-bisphosphate aldolase class I
MDKEVLKNTVARLTNPPKGILAADESTNTCNVRFEKLGIPTTEENRRAYRGLLITTPDIEKYISGYILYDETIRQSTKDGKSFTSVMQSKGIDIGIKVDTGVKDFPGHPGEKTTGGLEGLPGRLKEYKAMGATFAKFRTVYNISENTPSYELMKENAKVLAQYALDCHAENIVPIIEPEVLIEGTHSIEKSYEVNAKNLDIVFAEFSERNIFLPGVILKNSMVISGKEAAVRAPAELVAEMTVKCLKEHVPKDLGGIVFLSGGQSEEESTVHLNLMHKIGPLPWNLTFSYSRALQNSVLKHWAENPEDISGAQNIFIRAARANSLATLGEYEGKR